MSENLIILRQKNAERFITNIGDTGSKNYIVVMKKVLQNLAYTNDIDILPNSKVSVCNDTKRAFQRLVAGTLKQTYEQIAMSNGRTKQIPYRSLRVAARR